MVHHLRHPVNLGHLSGATDETFQRGRNPVNILRIIRGHVNQMVSKDVHYRDMFYIFWTHEVYRMLAESAHFARTFNSRFNDPYLAAAVRNMTSLCSLKLVVNANSKGVQYFQAILAHLFLSVRSKNVTFSGNVLLY
jgi:hypothetical protein